MGADPGREARGPSERAAALGGKEQPTKVRSRLLLVVLSGSLDAYASRARSHDEAIALGQVRALQTVDGDIPL